MLYCTLLLCVESPPGFEEDAGKNSPRLPIKIQNWPLLLGWLALLLISAVVILYVANRPESIPVDPLARYRAALKADAQPAVEALGPLPQYDINVTLNRELNQLQGTALIQVPNTSPDPWTYLIFRLYPALEQYGGLLSIAARRWAARPCLSRILRRTPRCVWNCPRPCSLVSKSPSISVGCSTFPNGRPMDPTPIVSLAAARRW